MPGTTAALSRISARRIPSKTETATSGLAWGILMRGKIGSGRGDGNQSSRAATGRGIRVFPEGHDDARAGESASASRQGRPNARCVDRCSRQLGKPAWSVLSKPVNARLQDAAWLRHDRAPHSVWIRRVTRFAIGGLKRMAACSGVTPEASGAWCSGRRNRPKAEGQETCPSRKLHPC